VTAIEFAIISIEYPSELCNFFRPFDLGKLNSPNTATLFPSRVEKDFRIFFQSDIGRRIGDIVFYFFRTLPEILFLNYLLC